MEIDLRRLIDALPGIVWTALPDGDVDFVNQFWCERTGFSSERSRGSGWLAAFAPEDLTELRERWRSILASGRPGEMKARLRRSDGRYRWSIARARPLTDDAGGIVKWCGTIQEIEEDAAEDIEDGRRTEAVLTGERRLLEIVAGGSSTSSVLEEFCRLVESTVPGCYSSVFLVGSDGRQLESGAAPSLPADLVAKLLEGTIAGESSPCAMVASRGEQVIAADLRTDGRWAGQKWLPMVLSHGLRACWSTPISSTSGRVLGTFALYYDEPRMPGPQEQALISQFTHLARISVQRAQGDAELKRSEARKTAILDSALDCIVTMDHEGRITEFNPAAERTFGFSREQVLGRALAEVIIPPRLREAHWQGLARYLATEEPHVLGRRVEMTALRADGAEFPVELAITRIPLEGPPSFTGYLRDVTGRKQAEDELRRSEALLAEAQRLSLTGSFYWQVASDDVTLSEQTYRTYGFEPGEPVTLEMIGARIHPQDAPLLRQMIAEARGPGGDLDYEYRLMLPDGTVRHLHLVAHGSHGTNGELEYIGAIQDVTQRRLSEEALGQAQSELAHVTRATTLGALTASIAHEVNQPLSGILTNASTCLKMLASEPPNLDGARETARRTIRDGQRASEVVGRLRALFANKGTAIEAVDLNDAAREVIALSSGEMQRGRVVLRTELAEDLPRVTGDRVQLQQVMLNLLRNALDAMSEVYDRPRELLIRTGREEGDRVRLSVRDAGEGLQAEGMDRLFDVFYTTKRGGMGVGLAVSRSIVESHRGRLWAEPNDGPGATFSFSIPALSTQTDARVGSPPGGTTATQTGSV